MNYSVNLLSFLKDADEIVITPRFIRVVGLHPFNQYKARNYIVFTP